MQHDSPGYATQRQLGQSGAAVGGHHHETAGCSWRTSRFCPGQAYRCLCVNADSLAAYGGSKLVQVAFRSLLQAIENLGSWRNA